MKAGSTSASTVSRANAQSVYDARKVFAGSVASAASYVVGRSRRKHQAGPATRASAVTASKTTRTRTRAVPFPFNSWCDTSAMSATGQIVSAGAVVTRKAVGSHSKAALEVLLVHRPKYDDWSF